MKTITVHLQTGARITFRGPTGGKYSMRMDSPGCWMELDLLPGELGQVVGVCEVLVEDDDAEERRP